MINNIEKTAINWIRDGERAEAVVLNRPTDKLVDLINTRLDEIKQSINDSSGTDENEVKQIINSEVPPLVQAGISETVPGMIDAKIDAIKPKPWAWINFSSPLLVNTKYKYNSVSYTLTITLPKTPKENDFIEIMSLGGSMRGDVIDRNGNTIMGIAENLSIDLDTYYIRLDYISGSWRIS